MHYEYRGRNYLFERYPTSSDPTLKPWNAGDEYLLQYIESVFPSPAKRIAVINDRFGFLTTLLQPYQPYTVIQYKSQEKALDLNLHNNGYMPDPSRMIKPLCPFPDKVDGALFRIPKSAALFEQNLLQLLPHMTDDAVVAGAFMTRHFNPKILAVAQNYFGEVTQSKAWKKSRLITLKNKKDTSRIPPLWKSLPFDQELTLHQYAGIFSNNRIDPGTRFLLTHLSLRPGEHTVLDLASGNGVIACVLHHQYPDLELHLLEDDYLAVESSKHNLPTPNAAFYWADNLEPLPRTTFDLIVCNPPFHLDYDNTTDVARALLREAGEHLKTNGRLVLVANRHLNYTTHLLPLFGEVTVLAVNKKYIVYNCEKKREGVQK